MNQPRHMHNDLQDYVKDLKGKLKNAPTDYRDAVLPAVDSLLDASAKFIESKKG